MLPQNLIEWLSLSTGSRMLPASWQASDYGFDDAMNAPLGK
jgi:hypothetical protein